MAADRPYPVPPRGELLAWMLENPAAVPELVMALNQLLTLEVRYVTPGSTTGANPLQRDNTKALLPLITKYRAGVPAAAATTVGSAVVTTGATTTTPYGYTTAAQANAIVTNLNALRVDVLALTAKLNAHLAAERDLQQSQP